MNEPTEESLPPESEPVVLHNKKWRKWPAVVILLIALIGLVLSKVFLADEQTTQSFSYYPIFLFTALGLSIWWTFFSRTKLKTRLFGWLGVVTVVILFNVLFKFERFTGDMLPSYSFRFASERTVEEFVSQQAESAELTEQKLKIGPQDWPEFRGVGRTGVVTNVGVDPDWDQNPLKEIWRHPVGLGWSSFVVVENHVFTQEQRGTKEAPKEAVVCYDLESGKQIWVHSDPVWFTEPLGGDGPRATPTFYDSHIYALGATGQLNCLEASTGKKIWSRNILVDAGANNLMWAMSASPLVYEDYVVTNPGIGPEGKDKSVIKYNRHTGEIVWGAGGHPASYVGPVLKTLGGVRQLVVYDGDGLTSYQEDSGEELWHYPWTNQPKVNSAIPEFFEDGTIFFSAGYNSGSARIKPVLKEDGSWGTEDVWVSPNVFRLKFNDGVVIGDYIYGLDDGVLACLDLNTGKRKWKRGRYGYGQLIQVDDYLLVLSEQGEIVLLEVSSKGPKVLAEVQAISGVTWNHPVVAGNKLLVRNAEEVACYELPLLKK